jgi:hypothetical protein
MDIAGDSDLLFALVLPWLASLARAGYAVATHETFGAEASLALVAVVVLPFLAVRSRLRLPRELVIDQNEQRARRRDPKLARGRPGWHQRMLAVGRGRRGPARAAVRSRAAVSPCAVTERYD